MSVHVASVDEFFSADEATSGRCFRFLRFFRNVSGRAKDWFDAGKSVARRTFLQGLRHEGEVECLALVQAFHQLGLGFDAFVDRPLDLPHHRVERQSSGLCFRHFWNTVVAFLGSHTCILLTFIPGVARWFDPLVIRMVLIFALQCFHGWFIVCTVRWVLADTSEDSLLPFPPLTNKLESPYIHAIWGIWGLVTRHT